MSQQELFWHKKDIWNDFKYGSTKVYPMHITQMLNLLFYF